MLEPARVSEAIRPCNGGVEIDVQVVPRASRSRVVGVQGERVRVQLAAPPVDGAANAELLELISDACGVPRRTIEIIRGETSRRKTVRIAAADVTEIRDALGGDT